MPYRLYKPDDFAALYAIEELCFKPPHRFSRGYMRQLIRQENAATWIAEDDGRMCGFGLVEWAREDEGVVAYVQTLEVIPEARGQGVGGELLRRMEGSACAAEAETIWLHVDAENAGAIRVYERHGFRLGGREEGYYGRGRAALIYAKPVYLKTATPDSRQPTLGTRTKTRQGWGRHQHMDALKKCKLQILQWAK